MGKKVYTATALTGGATGALDAINGSLLADGDLAIVTYGGRAYLYELDHDNSSTEASPYIISPDKNYGTKRWVLQQHGDAYYSMARAYLGAAITGLASGADTQVTFDTESFDIGSNFASSKYTAGIAGYYQVDWAVYMSSDGGTLNGGVSYLNKNATTSAGAVGLGVYASASGGFLVSTGSGLHYLALSDYLTVSAIGITSSSTWKMPATGGATFISVHLVSR